MEIISPILQHYDQVNEQLNDLNEKLSELKTQGFEFVHNNSTSNHVHFSHPLLNMFTNEHFEFYVHKIHKAWIYFEPVFFSMVSEERQDNDFCIPNFTICKVHCNSEQQLKDYLLRNSYELTFANTRYVALNLMPLADMTRGTFEVRLKHGTFLKSSIGSNQMRANIAWIQFLATFFTAALINKPITKMYTISKIRRLFFTCKPDINKLMKELTEFVRRACVDYRMERQIVDEFLSNYRKALLKS